MPSINSINYCPNCGSKIIHNANFCMECGYELKLLVEIITKHQTMNDSFEEQIEKDDNTLYKAEDTSEKIDTTENENTISDESSYSNKDMELIFDYATKESNNNESNIQEEIKEDFEIVRPDTEIDDNEYKKDTKTEKEEENISDENNNFNLVRPNSQTVTVKKAKNKKNFSILNQKK